jgi:hypothetical protein
MGTVRKHLRRLVGLALTAMLALTLLPAVAHALSFAQGDNIALSEICTSQGKQLLGLDGQAAGDDAPMTGIEHLDDCPYCASAASYLPSALPPMLLAPPAGSAAPPRFLHAPRTLFAWASAQPRAPPRVS